MKKIYCQACKQYYEIEDHLSASSYTCMRCQGPLVDAPAVVPLAVPASTASAGNVAVAQRPPKSRLTYCVLALLFGTLGFHNFYSGHNTQGIIKLVLTCVLWPTLVVPLGLLVWVLIEIVAVNADSSGRPFDNKFGCLGIAAILLLIVFVVTLPVTVPVVIFFPALSQACEKMCRTLNHSAQVACLSNLKQLGLAYYFYCDANGDTPPATWEQLLEYVVIDDDVSHCPAVPLTEDSRPSYRMVVYPVSNNKMSNPAAVPIIIEKLGNHPDSINICYADGHVEKKAVQADNYQALLPHFPGLDHATQAALEEQLRQWDADPNW